MLVVRPSTLLLILMASAILVFSATKASTSGNDGKGTEKKGSYADGKYDEKIVVNKRNIAHQYLQRAFPNAFGKQMLDEKASMLMDLKKYPILGSYKNYCEAMMSNCRSLYHYGSFLLPQSSFMFYASMGHVLRDSNNATKRWYNDFYDSISDYFGCDGEDAAIIVERVYEYYQKKLYVKGRSETRTYILGEMASMNKSIHDLIWEDEVRFEPSCKLDVYREYFEEKLPELDAMVEEMNVEMTDDQVFDVLLHHKMLTPMVTTFYICVGFRGEIKEEVRRSESILYKIRQSFNGIMQKEEEREAHLMTGPQNADKFLGDGFYRHTSIRIPAGSTLECGNKTESFTEDKIINVFNCGHECRRIFTEDQSLVAQGKKESCGIVHGDVVGCDDCFVLIPNNLYKDSDFRQYASVKVHMDDEVVIILPQRNLALPKLTLPELKMEDMLEMANRNITPKVERPDNFFPHEYPQRQFYQKPRTTGKIDWRKICWEALYVHIATTVILWTVYLSAAYYPFLRLWWRQRRQHQD